MNFLVAKNRNVYTDRYSADAAPKLQQSPEYSTVPTNRGVGGVDGEKVPLRRPQH